MSEEETISESTLFVDGAARFKDLIYIVARDRGLQDEAVEHSRFIAFDQQNFCHNGDRNWSGIAICVVKKPTEKMVSVGEDGEVLTYVGGTVTEEQIVPEPMALRNLGVIDGLAYACGMNRQVFRRDDENSWTAMHAPGSASEAGFEAIDGFSADEIYAVGWNGEIVQWDGNDWSNHNAPTNVILTGVCCGGDDTVYVCGQQGTVLSGRGNTWQLLDLAPMVEDFWDVHWFQGKLYLATAFGLWTLEEGVLTQVDFGDDAPSSCNRLSSAEGTLWSVGADDVFCFDGTEWTRID